jgi:tetratricopeptide (TPR) repeat protein
VAEALRIDLPQSPVLQLVDRSELGPALRRMARDPRERLEEDVARELAVREGIAAVLVGEVARVGTDYQITVRLITPDSGHVLFRGRETASGEGAVLSAVERLSARLRERVGESLRSIRSSPPLLRVTTPSLAALQLYSTAARVGSAADPDDTQKAIQLLEQALEADSLFAIAWTALGIYLVNAGMERGRRMHALTRAVQLEDRLSEGERYRARGAYYRWVEGDLERAIAAYEQALATSPDHASTHNNLGVLYGAVADYEAAARCLERAVQFDPTATSLTNLLFYRLALGDAAGARAVLEERQRLYPDNPTNARWAARLAYMAGDFATARDTLLAVLDRAGPRLRPLILEDLAAIECRAGRIRECWRLTERSAALSNEVGRPDGAIWNTMQVAFTDLFILGQNDRTKTRVRAALEAFQQAGIPPLEAAWLMPALLLAVAGEPAAARALLEGWREAVPVGVQRQLEKQAAGVDGAIAMAEGRIEEGIRMHRWATERSNGNHLTVPLLALAYDHAGQADSALAVYHRVETLRTWNRPTMDLLFLALAYERMAELHETRGDVRESVHYYQLLIDLWADADPELQPRVAAARGALVRLAREG